MVNVDLTGTGVAIITPFRDDGSIDFQSLKDLVKFHIDEGINYLVVLGTTGESVTLSTDEKSAVVSYVIDLVNNQVPIVIGIGGNNTQQVVNQIKSTDFTGISAILSVAPYYNKPSQEGIFEHYKTIATSSPVPVILYNVPGRTGVNISAETTLQLAHAYDNIIAVKEASGDLVQVMHILKDKPPHFKVISGDDALTLPLIALGGSGVISVIANAYPKEFSKAVNLALNNQLDNARDQHYRLLDMIDLLFSEGSPAGIKALLEILGKTKNNLRLPLMKVSDETYKQIKYLAANLK